MAAWRFTSKRCPRSAAGVIRRHGYRRGVNGMPRFYRPTRMGHGQKRVNAARHAQSIINESISSMVHGRQPVDIMYPQHHFWRTSPLKRGLVYSITDRERLHRQVREQWRACSRRHSLPKAPASMSFIIFMNAAASSPTAHRLLRA